MSRVICDRYKKCIHECYHIKSHPVDGTHCHVIKCVKNEGNAICRPLTTEELIEISY